MNEASAALPEWIRRKERGTQFALRVMRHVSLLLGRRTSRLVVHGIAFYFVLMAGPARRASRDYLRRVLGRPPGWADLYRHVFTFATTIHDRVYLLNDREELFDVRVHGADGLHERAAAGGGVLVLGAHLGSFELLRTAARARPGLELCMAMYPDNARRISGALAAINPRATHSILALGNVDAMIELHRRLEGGALVGMLADRSLRDDAMRTADFFGAPARFPAGPFRIAALLRRPVFFVVGLYRGGNRYDVHVEPLADFDSAAMRGGGAGNRARIEAELLQNYVAALERHCRTAPWNWFNFFDFWGTGGRA
jgi:predicted LPLAT superfamily acyltransferase